MTRLRVAPIVEGHGEYECIRILIDRVWRELLGGVYVDVLRPIRQSRYRLIKQEEVHRAVTLALNKLADVRGAGEPELVLILLDADKDLACELGPQLLEYAKQVHPSADVSCVVAAVEYETWFVAAAESLREYLDLPPDAVVPENPEELRMGKGWIERRFKGTKYSETQDQPRMTARMDLALCRRRSPSFDKLCREFERRTVGS